MTYRSRILDTANRELGEIVAYLAANSKNAASAFLDEYEKQLDLICSGLASYGLSRMPELAQLGYHVALVGHYAFLYYEEDGVIVVAHLFHQKQDYASIVAPQ